MVRGKNNFRLTGGEFIENIFFTLGLEKSIKIKNYLNLIESVFIKGHKEDVVYKLSEKFIKEARVTTDLEKTEFYFIIKLLEYLGYFDLNFLSDNDLDLENLILDDSKKKKLVQEINKNIKKVIF